MPVKRRRSASPSPPRRAAEHRSGQNAAPSSATSSAQMRPIITAGSSSSPRHSIADLFPYQELFLRVLSFLSPTELASIQGVSKYWSRMTLDPQLWKRLYLARYPHPHYSKLIYRESIRGSDTPRRLRPIARLPSRAFPPPSPSRSRSASAVSSTPDPSASAQTSIAERSPHSNANYGNNDEAFVGYGVRNDGVDWKQMLRLGTNWSNGNAPSQTTIPLPPSPSPSQTSTLHPTTTPRPPPYSEQHIALFPSFIFTSSPTSPLVHVHHSSSPASAAAAGIIPPPPGWSSPHRPDNVTALCADQSVSVPDDQNEHEKRQLPARLAVFYQSGGYAILRVRSDGQSHINWVRESIHPAQNRPKSLRRRATAYSPLDGDPVVLATMHYPLLLTCTLAFHLSVYVIPESRSSETTTRPKHLATMHSDVSFHPAALSLLPSPEEAGFKAALTYCTPLYPSSWTIAVQEFSVKANRSLSTGSVARGECYHVGRGDENNEAEDTDIWPRRVKPIIGVKGHSAVGVGTDGRWCVLAGEDNQIQVYSLPTPSPSPPPRTPPIVHAQTLLAHSAAVTSISFASGRCVSGGKDGRILVWELDDEDMDEKHVGGRTVGYVEVRQGGRKWRGPSGPMVVPEGEDLEEDEGEHGEGQRMDLRRLPHPASISSAARSLFLPRPPEFKDDRPPAIKHLVFDEEKIVGLVKLEDVGDKGEGNAGGEVMRVWSFNA